MVSNVTYAALAVGASEVTGVTNFTGIGAGGGSESDGPDFGGFSPPGLNLSFEMPQAATRGLSSDAMLSLAEQFTQAQPSVETIRDTFDAGVEAGKDTVEETTGGVSRDVIESLTQGPGGLLEGDGDGNIQVGPDTVQVGPADGVDFTVFDFGDSPGFDTGGFDTSAAVEAATLPGQVAAGGLMAGVGAARNVEVPNLPDAPSLPDVDTSKYSTGFTEGFIDPLKGDNTSPSERTKDELDGGLRKQVTKNDATEKKKDEYSGSGGGGGMVV